MPKISVIIPVFNVEEYLSNCLDSILNQSFKDIEIICVNDGSSDNSLQILNQYAANDSRVIVVNKDNEGSGVARNVGLSIAKGEYVFFVDGDDWLEKNIFEPMLEKAVSDKTDILIFGGLSYYGETGKCGGYSCDKLPKKYLNRVFSANDVKKDIFKFPSTAWTKLYRREFLTDNYIKFQNIKAGQDQLPFFHSMITAERISVLPLNLYCYRKNRKGAVTAVKKKKNFSPIFVFYAIEELLETTNKPDDYKAIFVNKYFSKATSWLGKFEPSLKQSYYEEYIKLLQHIQEKYPFGWWTKFNPKASDGYYQLKIKQFVAKKLNFMIK